MLRALQDGIKAYPRSIKKINQKGHTPYYLRTKSKSAGRERVY